MDYCNEKQEKLYKIIWGVVYSIPPFETTKKRIKEEITARAEEIRALAREVIEEKEIDMENISEPLTLIEDIEDHYFDGGKLIFIPPSSLKICLRANYEDGWKFCFEIPFE